MKCCSKCGASKPLDEFYKNRASADGYYPSCKVCSKKASAAWIARNPAKNTEIQRRGSRKYRARHRLEINARAKLRRASLSPEQRDARLKQACANSKAYRAKNPEACYVTHRKWIVRNRTHIWEQRRSYAAQLSDGYVRSFFTYDTALSAADIPPELIPLKRLQLQLKRALRTS